MPDYIDAGSIVFGIAIADKRLITAMQRFNTFGMFNRAPELFGTPRYFLHISEQAIDVAAISTVNLFYKIQILEIVPIKNNIILPVYFRDFVNRKTDGLIRADRRIHE